jgi:transposase-like protein
MPAGRKQKYSAKLVAEICELLASGKYTVHDVCKQVDLSETMYYDWKNKKPEFSEAIKNAEKKRLESFKNMALSGLAKLLTEHEYEETHTEYENGPENKPIIKFQKRVKKKVMPNATAVIFTLTNREGEDWKHQNNIDHTTKGESLNKGFYDAVMKIKTNGQP